MKISTLANITLGKEMKNMKVSLIVLAIATMFVMASATLAFAVTPYGPLEYNVLTGQGLGSGDDIGWPDNANPQGLTNQWAYFSNSIDRGYRFVGFTTSTHPQGTWNSPYTAGVDGYNYNDPQDYVSVVGGNITFYWNPVKSFWVPIYPYDANGDGIKETFAASTPGSYGPHGNYTTTTHKCRECHAVHRAAGKFKLTRADTREEACDWCHGKGAGSGFNIQMDNDDEMTREYDVGHSLGFNLNTGKWKAPDDTDPAYDLHSSTGGFSCFDCHSPHANKQRLLGWISDLRTGGTLNVQVPSTIVNSGNDEGVQAVPWPRTSNPPVTFKHKPIFPAGRWLLLENPDDGENADDNNTTALGPSGYQINKVPINWNFPYGTCDDSEVIGSNAYLNLATCFGVSVSEFCTDCHDGNAGLHTQRAAMFSEDRALRNQASYYDIGYSHDTMPRH